MSKKRILIIGWASSEHIKRWCASLAQRNLEIKLISTDGEPLESVETVTLPRASKLSFFRHVARVREEAQKFNPDIVHSHYVAGNGYLGMRCGVSPFLVSVWGSDIDKNLNNWLVSRVVKKVLHAADHITATSEYLRKQIEAACGTTKENHSVIPFGVDVPDRYEPIRGTDTIRICFIKGTRPIYGADVLLKALAIARKTKPGIELSVAGADVESLDSLKSLSEQLGLENSVRFVGYINHGDIYSFIRRHHFMAMPSRVEAFGVAALEAAACGRAVVATNVGGIPEVVHHDKTGLLVAVDNVEALADAVLRLVNDIELCNKLGWAGYEFVKQTYPWHKSVDRMCELYERLIYEAKKEKQTNPPV